MSSAAPVLSFACWDLVQVMCEDKRLSAQCVVSFFHTCFYFFSVRGHINSTFDLRHHCKLAVQ